MAHLVIVVGARVAGIVTDADRLLSPLTAS
jgi:hypothetical protein